MIIILMLFSKLFLLLIFQVTVMQAINEEAIIACKNAN